jgi:hypothetical protein
VLKLMARYPDKLWFNKDLELVKKGVTIELTNICDLLRDLLQRREQASPLAWRLFIEGLYSIKIPQNLIGNVDRINYLSGLKTGINPDTLTRVSKRKYGLKKTDDIENLSPVVSPVELPGIRSNIESTLPKGSWNVSGKKSNTFKKIYTSDDEVVDEEGEDDQDSDATIDYGNYRKRRRDSDDDDVIDTQARKRTKRLLSRGGDDDESIPMDVSSSMKRKHDDFIDVDTSYDVKRLKTKPHKSRGEWFAYQR